MNTTVLRRTSPQVVRAGLETREVTVKDLRLLEGLGQEVTTHELCTAPLLGQLSCSSSHPDYLE